MLFLDTELLNADTILIVLIVFKSRVSTTDFASDFMGYVFV